MPPDTITLRVQDLEQVLEADLVDRLRWLQGLFIQGVEVTQGIQYYRSSAHLTDPGDQAADNSVTLIAGKPAWVRVYVRSGFWVGDLSGVTGSLEVNKRTHGFLYFSTATLSPQPPGTVTARTNPDYATERGTLSYTLNFLIPAEYMCGNLKLVIDLTAPGGHSASTTVNLNVTLQQTLRLAGIMVGYNGPTSTAAGAPNLTLAAPTVANLQTTSAWTLLTFPVRSTANYRSAGTITWNLPLTDAPSCAGCCSPNWVALNAAVQAQMVADGNDPDVLYYGLMAVGIPMGPIIGCNTGSVSTGSNGDGVTMAHELGHHCGLPHAPCGTPGDPNYPAYEPYDPAATPQASIGEYGLDVSTGAIFSPATFKDLMSYCGPRWISLYNYGRLTNNANLDPVRVCMDHPWWRDWVLYDPILIPERWLPDPPPDPIWRERFVNPEPVISIIGVVHSEREIEIKSLMRLDTVSQVRNGTVTELSAELVGKEGRPVSEAPLYRIRSYGHKGCGCEEDAGESRYPYLFQAFVSDVEPGAALRIRRGEDEVWRREAPKGRLRVAEFGAELGKGEQLTVWWGIDTPEKMEQEPESWLQWSRDRGKTWHALTTGLRGKQAVVDASGLPSGWVQLRLLASDGFRTATSRRAAIRILKRPPDVSILSPRDGQTLVAGMAMRLWGVATRDGEPVPDRYARWLLDGKPVARGQDAFITAPPEGTHKLTLVVSAYRKRVEQTVTFKTVGLPEEGETNPTKLG